MPSIFQRLMAPRARIAGLVNLLLRPRSIARFRELNAHVKKWLMPSCLTNFTV